MRKLVRYKRLACPEELALEITDREARLRFHWVLAVDEHPPALLVDATFASVIALGRRGVGKPARVRRLELTSRRAGAALLTRYFGCEIHFGAPINVLILDRSALAEPFLTHNEDLLAALLPGLETALDELDVAPKLVDNVKAVIRRRMNGGRPGVEWVAEEVRMSTRTLQRRLGEAGTSYQALLDEVRREAARRLLADTDLNTGEVAFLLGFEELNSCTRAFHSWEGTTPGRWRASAGHRAGPHLSIAR